MTRDRRFGALAASARITLASAIGFLACACATPIQPSPDAACRITAAVLSPVVLAAEQAGQSVELTAETRLWPGDAAAWSRIARLGFAPRWRSAGMEQALNAAYWPAYMRLRREGGRSSPEADLQAWAIAHADVGEDRVFLEPAFWAAFLRRNERAAPTPCGAALAARFEADLIALDAPRAQTALRVEPSQIVLDSDGSRALIAARTLHPGLGEGEARQTGTVWLLRRLPSGAWTVTNARRTAGE